MTPRNVISIALCFGFPALVNLPAAEVQKLWGFAPLRTVSIPNGTAAHPIDRFIAVEHLGASRHFAAEADRRTLLRRLTFDLTGLPPTPEELEAYQHDNTPFAYDREVDRLLASPRFGERWARHWLDLVRYADSNGYERDGDRPTVWHYRDFVIRAFNADLPYDTFIHWQLAGDQSHEKAHDAKVATAFIGLGPVVETDTKLTEELARYRYADLDDMVSTTGSAFLGLTLGCARCHDHKFDPISTREYYSILDAFVGVERRELPLASEMQVQQHAAQLAHHQERVTAAKKALEVWWAQTEAELRPQLIKSAVASSSTGGAEPKWTEADYVKVLAPSQSYELTQLKERLRLAEREKPAALETAMVITESTQGAPPSFLLKRGDPALPGEAVSFGFLSVLSRNKRPLEYLQDGAQAPVNVPQTGSTLDRTNKRLALARWITDVEHGAGALTARVIVNRLWQHHFGDALVKTPSDFGSQSEPPTNPDLLEWLAGELVRNGWKLKPIHRVIVTSAAYRQRSGTELPTERVTGSRRPRRLEAEALRDTLLAVSGTLNETMTGPSVKSPIAAELNVAYNTKDPYPTTVEETHLSHRRSVYLFTKRSLRQPLLELFDGPDPSASCARRIPTTVAPQALALLNDPFIRARAKDFAARIRREVGEHVEQQVSRAYALSLGRLPRPFELTESLAFIQQQAAARAQSAEAALDAEARNLALIDFCQVMFGLNEFIYVD